MKNVQVQHSIDQGLIDEQGERKSPTMDFSLLMADKNLSKTQVNRSMKGHSNHRSEKDK